MHLPKGNAAPKDESTHMTLMRRTLTRSVLVLTLLSAAIPADARVSQKPDRALASARATAARLQARADAIRADLDSGSFERAVGRLALMADVAATPPPVADPRPVQGLPKAVAAPIADLLTAARDAAVRMDTAIRADGGASLARSRRADRLGQRIALALAQGQRWPVERARALKAQVRTSGMLRAAATGGMGIGAALDRALPALRAGAATLPRRTSPAAACDVLDQRPLLCVNGTGPNAIDAEAVLLVDLGGDDTYTSSAGSASSARCVDLPDDRSCQASLLIDLDGDDTYAVGGAVRQNHLVAAGSALVGIGMLVDAAGDDSYIADVRGRNSRLDISFVFGSADTGLGLLADLTGDDSYEVLAEPGDTFNPYTHGSSLTGMGTLLDFDGTNVYRTIIAGEQRPLGEGKSPYDSVISMGSGVFGGAAMLDRTGYATLEARVTATAGADRMYATVNPIAHGVALIGQGALLTGAGPTTFDAIATRVATVSLPGQSEDLPKDEQGFELPAATIPGGAFVTAHAVAALGFAVLDDLGGDDAYRAIARSEHHLLVTADESCSCDRAIATLDVTGESELGGSAPAGGGISTQGLGSAIFAPDAGALLHDHGGDDEYTGRTQLVVTARAENRLGAGETRAEAYPYAFPQLNAFGQGLGSDFAPSILLDDAGDDRYELSTDSSVDATAEGPEADSTAVGGMVATHGQGASFWDPAQGALLDLGGRDTYDARAISRTTASPVPRAYDAGRTIGAQGSVGGVLADLDDALPDVFTATPEPNPGVGFRGEGPGWVDISKTFPGYGIAPLQPAKRDVVLAMDPANTAAANDGLVPFRARLTDGGSGLPGQEVTFDIEFRSPGLAGETWTRHRFAAHGITAADGWASGVIDVGEYVGYHGGAADMIVRIAARFHGDSAHRPAMATGSLTVSA